MSSGGNPPNPNHGFQVPDPGTNNQQPPALINQTNGREFLPHNNPNVQHVFSLHPHLAPPLALPQAIGQPIMVPGGDFQTAHTVLTGLFDDLRLGRDPDPQNIIQFVNPAFLLTHLNTLIAEPNSPFFTARKRFMERLSAVLQARASFQLLMPAQFLPNQPAAPLNINSNIPSPATNPPASDPSTPGLGGNMEASPATSQAPDLNNDTLLGLSLRLKGWLEDKIAEVQTLGEQVKSLEQALKEANGRGETARDQVNQLNLDLTGTQCQLDGARIEAQRALTASQGETSTAQAQAARAQSALRRSQCAAARRTALYKQRLANNRRTRQALGRTLNQERTNANHRIAELNAEIENLRLTNNERLEEERAGRRTADERVAELNAEMDSLRLEHSAALGQVNQRLVAAQLERDAALGNLRNRNNDVNRLNDQLEELNDNLSGMEVRANTAERDRDSARSEVRRLSTASSALAITVRHQGGARDLERLEHDASLRAERQRVAAAQTERDFAIAERDTANTEVRRLSTACLAVAVTVQQRGQAHAQELLQHSAALREERQRVQTARTERNSAIEARNTAITAANESARRSEEKTRKLEEEKNHALNTSKQLSLSNIEMWNKLQVAETSAKGASSEAARNLEANRQNQLDLDSANEEIRQLRAAIEEASEREARLVRERDAAVGEIAGYKRIFGRMAKGEVPVFAQAPRHRPALARIEEVEEPLEEDPAEEAVGQGPDPENPVNIEVPVDQAPEPEIPKVPIVSVVERGSGTRRRGRGRPSGSSRGAARAAAPRASESPERHLTREQAVEHSSSDRVREIAGFLKQNHCLYDPTNDAHPQTVSNPPRIHYLIKWYKEGLSSDAASKLPPDDELEVIMREREALIYLEHKKQKKYHMIVPLSRSQLKARKRKRIGSGETSRGLKRRKVAEEVKDSNSEAREEEFEEQYDEPDKVDRDLPSGRRDDDEEDGAGGTGAGIGLMANQPGSSGIVAF